MGEVVVTVVFAALAATSCGTEPTCFAGGTLVATPAGPKRIEALEVGQPVLAFDEAAGRVRASTIMAVYRHTGSRIVIAKVGRTALRLTAEHPVYSVGRQAYARAGDLEAGDRVLSLLANMRKWEVEVATVQGVPKPTGDEAAVYNIQVAIYANFFANGILVHNKHPDGFIIPPPRDIEQPSELD